MVFSEILSFDNSRAWKELIIYSPGYPAINEYKYARTSVKHIIDNNIENATDIILDSIKNASNVILQVRAEPADYMQPSQVPSRLRARLPLVVIFGDLHHKWNPYLFAYHYIEALKPDLILCASCPHVTSLATAGMNIPLSLYPWNHPIPPDLQSNKITSLPENSELIYFGTLSSQFHPRRTEVLQSIQASSNKLIHVPYQTTLKWYESLKLSGIHFYCSLNSQFSHNFFVPLLWGHRIIADEGALSNPFIQIAGENPEGVFTYSQSDFENTFINALGDAKSFGKELGSKKLVNRNINESYGVRRDNSYLNYFSSEFLEINNFYKDKIYNLLPLCNNSSISKPALCSLFDVLQEIHRVIIRNLRLIVYASKIVFDAVNFALRPYHMFEVEHGVSSEIFTDEPKVDILAEKLKFSLSIYPPGSNESPSRLWADHLNSYQHLLPLCGVFYPFEQVFYGRVEILPLESRLGVIPSHA